jgi:ribosomal protein L37AE/L43A
MSTINHIGLLTASAIADRLSPYQLRRLAALYAEKSRPEVERQAYECPICGHHGPLDPFFGAKAIRFDAHCPQCNSRERHRLFKLWTLSDCRGTRFGDVLHFAPEAELSDVLGPRSKTYRTADIAPGRADLQLNIEAIDLPSDSVDTVIANHVLEHVNDALALSEIRRILRPGGFAILTTPVIPAWEQTYESANVNDPDQRFRHFGQEDHVRFFGRDIEERIRGAGFDLQLFVANGAESARYALIPGDTIYVATRLAD